MIQTFFTLLFSKMFWNLFIIMNKCSWSRMYLWISKYYVNRNIMQKSLGNRSLRKWYKSCFVINIRSTNVTERGTLTEETVVAPTVRTCIKRFTHVFISARRLFCVVLVYMYWGSEWRVYALKRFGACSMI